MYPQDNLPNPISNYQQQPADDRYPKAVPFAGVGNGKQQYL